VTTRRRTSRFVRALVVTALAAATLTALVAGTSAGAASSNTLSITAGEYVYKLSGSPAPGWVQFDFKNSGVEDHMMVVFSLKPGTTAKQLKAAIASESDDAFGKIAAGEPLSGTPAIVGPKQQTTTIAEAKAGTYGIVCFVPAPDGSPHAAHGMYKIFQIKGSKSSFKPPSDGVDDVTLSDTSITVPGTVAPKSATIKVTNEGSSPHSFQLLKLNAGKTLDDANTYFNAFFETGQADGAAPGVLVGGVSTIAPGGMAYLEWELPAGHYGYLSTEGDAPDDDFSKGLKGEFDIS
jgi:hypothetical protein